MEDRSLFISSCNRRELARRRSHRHALRLVGSVTLLLFAAALGALIAARGGI